MNCSDIAPPTIYMYVTRKRSAAGAVTIVCSMAK